MQGWCLMFGLRLEQYLLIQAHDWAQYWKGQEIFLCLWQHWGIPRHHLSPLVLLCDRDLCYANPFLWMWVLVSLWQLIESSKSLPWWALQEGVVFRHCLNDCYGLSISWSTLLNQKTLIPTSDHKLFQHSQFTNSCSSLGWHWVWLSHPRVPWTWRTPQYEPHSLTSDFELWPCHAICDTNQEAGYK